MAEENKKIIVDIEIAGKEAIDTIIQTTDELEHLNKQLEFAKATKKYAVPDSEDYKEATEQIALLTATQKDLNKTLSAAKKEVQDNIDKHKELGDSLNDERKKLKNLISEFDNLSAAERDAAPGKQLLDQITAQTKKVTDLEVATGRHQRLVGSYKEAIKDASTQMGELSEGLNGLGIAGGKSVFNFSRLGKVFTSLASNPWFTVVTLFANIMTKVSEAVKKNESAMTAFNKVGEIAGSIWSSVEVVFEKLADWLGVAASKLVEWAGKLGLATEEQSDFAKAQKEMIDKQKEAVKGIQSEIGEVKLLHKAVKDSNLSYEQRKAALDKLKKIVPDYHASLTKEGKLVNDNTTAIDNYIKSLKKKAKAEAQYEVLKGYYAELEKINEILAERNKLEKTKDGREIITADLYNRMKEYGGWDNIIDRYNTLLKLTKEFKIEIPIEPVVKDTSGKVVKDKSGKAGKEELSEAQKLIKQVQEDVKTFSSTSVDEINTVYSTEIRKLNDLLENEKLSVKDRKAINDQIFQLEVDRVNAVEKAEESAKSYISSLNAQDVADNIAKNKQILSDTAKSYEERYKALTEYNNQTEEEAAKKRDKELKDLDAREQAAKAALDPTAENYQEMVADIESATEQAKDRVWDAYNTVVETNEDAVKKLKSDSVSDAIKQIFGDISNSANLSIASVVESAETAKKKLEKLRDQGLITQEEFKKQSEKLTNETNDLVVNRVEVLSSTLSGITSQFTDAVGSLFDALIKDERKQGKAAKAFAYMQIWLNAGIASSAAILKAVQSSATWIDMVIGIATAVATTVSAIAQTIALAKKADSYSFATGGLIGGRTARSNEEGTRDDVRINASRGEYVIKASKVKEYGVDFFDAINGNGHLSFDNNFASGGLVQTPIIQTSPLEFDYDRLVNGITEGVTSAVGDLPSPVVSVKDIASGIDNLTIKQRKSGRTIIKY